MEDSVNILYKFKPNQKEDVTKFLEFIHNLMDDDNETSFKEIKSFLDFKKKSINYFVEQTKDQLNINFLPDKPKDERPENVSCVTYIKNQNISLPSGENITTNIFKYDDSKEKPEPEMTHQKTMFQDEEKLKNELKIIEKFEKQLKYKLENNEKSEKPLKYKLEINEKSEKQLKDKLEISEKSEKQLKDKLEISEKSEKQLKDENTSLKCQLKEEKETVIKCKNGAENLAIKFRKQEKEILDLEKTIENECEISKELKRRLILAEENLRTSRSISEENPESIDNVAYRESVDLLTNLLNENSLDS